MNDKNPAVDAFIAREKRWQKEFIELRRIALDSGLIEEVKWGVPCYTLNGKNVLLIHGFKEYCGMLFVKGALLADPKSILITQTESVQAARQLRFTNLSEVLALEVDIKALMVEAIGVEKAGKKVEFKQTSEFHMPEEFRARLEADPALERAFTGLTPGRQRAYLLYFAAPKTAGTRVERVEKSIPRILAGKGLND